LVRGGKGNPRTPEGNFHNRLALRASRVGKGKAARGGSNEHTPPEGPGGLLIKIPAQKANWQGANGRRKDQTGAQGQLSKTIQIKKRCGGGGPIVVGHLKEETCCRHRLGKKRTVKNPNEEKTKHPPFDQNGPQRKGRGEWAAAVKTSLRRLLRQGVIKLMKTSTHRGIYVGTCRLCREDVRRTTQMIVRKNKWKGRELKKRNRDRPLQITTKRNRKYVKRQERWKQEGEINFKDLPDLGKTGEQSSGNIHVRR